MTVLRVYDPAECDEDGVPLDWECCHACNGDGVISTAPGIQSIGAPFDPATLVTCERCAGHGSLKAAALAGKVYIVGDPGRWVQRAPDAVQFVRDPPTRTARCEDCGHPISGGTWAGDTITDGRRGHEDWRKRTFAYAESMLRAGLDIPADFSVHYSPCDEACRHGGPGRLNGAEVDDVLDIGDVFHGRDQTTIEASWRQVDVRTLGWPHDLRPEKLAVLCLRCWAERTASLWLAAGSTGPATAATFPVATTGHTSATAAPASTTMPTL